MQVEREMHQKEEKKSWHGIWIALGIMVVSTRGVEYDMLEAVDEHDGGRSRGGHRALACWRPIGYWIAWDEAAFYSERFSIGLAHWIGLGSEHWTWLDMAGHGLLGSGDDYETETETEPLAWARALALALASQHSSSSELARPSLSSP